MKTLLEMANEHNGPMELLPYQQRYLDRISSPLRVSIIGPSFDSAKTSYAKITALAADLKRQIAAADALIKARSIKDVSPRIRGERMHGFMLDDLDGITEWDKNAVTVTSTPRGDDENALFWDWVMGLHGNRPAQKRRAERLIKNACAGVV